MPLKLKTTFLLVKSLFPLRTLSWREKTKEKNNTVRVITLPTIYAATSVVESSSLGEAFAITSATGVVGNSFKNWV